MITLQKAALAVIFLSIGFLLGATVHQSPEHGDCGHAQSRNSLFTGKYRVGRNLQEIDTNLAAFAYKYNYAVTWPHPYPGQARLVFQLWRDDAFLVVLADQTAGEAEIHIYENRDGYPTPMMLRTIASELSSAFRADIN